MTREEYLALHKEVMGECYAVSEQATKEYGQNDNALFNFDRDAYILGIEPEITCEVHMLKHIGGIAKYIKSREKQRDSFKTRIVDAINYLILLYAIVTRNERRNMENRNIFTPAHLQNQPGLQRGIDLDLPQVKKG